MSVRSILMRTAVAAAFLALGIALLAAERTVDTAAGEFGPARRDSYLIVTGDSLSAPFHALARWIREEGGSAVVFTLEDLSPGPPRLAPAGSELRYLVRLGGRCGYERVLLGGAHAALGVPSRFLEPGVERVAVANRAEAWSYVDWCRSRGLPLVVPLDPASSYAQAARALEPDDVGGPPPIPGIAAAAFPAGAPSVRE